MSEHSRYRAGLWLPDEKPIYGTPLNPFHPLAKGLVGCWICNEAGGNKVFDLSLNGNHGIFVNSPTWDVVETGLAVKFDVGTVDYIVLSDYCNVSPTSEVTILIRAWVNTGSDGVLMRDQTADSSNRITCHIYSNTPYFDWGNKDGNGRLQYTDNDCRDQWIWWAFVSSAKSSFQGIYKNTVLVAQDNTTENFTHYDGDLDIATRNSGAGYNLGGWISDVFIYDCRLLAPEITQLYAEPYCMFAQPMEAELFYAAPPVGLSIPVAMHHYEMLRV